MEQNLSLLSNVSRTVHLKIGLVYLVPQSCRTIMIIFITIIFFTGLPGNVIVILVQTKIKRKTSTDWLVTFLAVLDVLSVTISIPINVILTKEWWPQIGSTFGCRFNYFVIHLTFAASTIIFAYIALDRLWRTRAARLQFSPTSALNCSITALGVSIILGVMAAFSMKENLLGQCIFDPSRKTLQTVLYTIILTIVVFSSCIMFYSYIRIFIFLKYRMKVVPVFHMSTVSCEGTRHAPASYSDSQYGKAVKTTKLMGLVTIIFIVSAIIPAIAVIILTSMDSRNSKNGRIAIFFITRLFFINNCTNPYFYFWLNVAFRKRALIFLKSIRLTCFSV